jgi:hypothetical protein
MDIRPVSIDALPEYSGLNGRNANNYYKAGQRRAFICSEVTNPFETSLRESTTYSDSNIPKREKEIPIDIGDFAFLLRATPTRKRPEYKEVVEDLGDFLWTKLEEYRAGERPAGMITIKDEPYIPVDMVLGRIRDSREEGNSRGVRITIAERPDIPENVYSVVVPLGMDISLLTEGNAARYLESLSIQEGYDRFTSSFEGDLLGLTTFSDDNPPRQTEHMYRKIGRHIFHVRSIPYESTSWGRVLSGLESEPPKRNPESGGDLTLIEMGIEIPRLEIYATRKRGGKPLVRLKGLLSRVSDLTQENTSTKVRQRPINHYPIV